MRYNITKIDHNDKAEIIFKTDNFEKASAHFLRISRTTILPTRQAHNSQISQLFQTLSCGIAHTGEMIYLIKKQNF